VAVGGGKSHSHFFQRKRKQMAGTFVLVIGGNKMRHKSWKVFAASAVFVVLISGIGQGISGECAVELAAEHIAGFQPGRSVAVEQAVDFIRRGDYSLALLRLTSERQDTSMPAQARIFSAYALLVAGNTLGAFPEQS